MMLVMDCDAAINIVLGTSDGKALRNLVLEGETIIAPDLFVSEAANVISKYAKGGYLSQDQVKVLLQASLELVDEYVRCADMSLEVLSESIRLEHSAYDLFYFVLARRNGATLMTLDRELQKLCAENGVNRIYIDTEF